MDSSPVDTLVRRPKKRPAAGHEFGDAQGESAGGGSRAEPPFRDTARAEKVIGFIEKLTVPSGQGQGHLFKLMPFEKRFIRDIYEPHSKAGRRLVRRAILSIARKNGKTALIAALALVHLIGPEAIPNGEIYSAANDTDQAAIIYKFASQIVKLEPELARHIDLIPSTKTMIGRATGSVYRAVSREAATKHGFSPTVVIYDELAQALGRKLYDVFDTSFGARSEPLFVAISTQSNDPEHILSKLIDDGLSGVDPSIICHLYAADEECDLDDEAQWKKANPALDVFRDREDLATAIRKAIRMPAEEPKVRNLFLNQRVSPNAPLISRVEWLGSAGPADFTDGEEVFLGLDLASVVDLAALVMISADNPTRVQPFFWKPEAMLAEHSRRDFGSGNSRYQLWAEDGLLRLSPGRSIDPNVIAIAIAEIHQRFRVRGLAYDRWRISDLIREFDRIGLRAYKDGDKGDGLRLVPWGQGYRDMAPAIDALELALFEHRLAHPNHPILNWNMSNAIATTDPAGNRKLNKDKARFRIDGAVALAMAMGLKSRDPAAKIIDIDALIG
jgi:phage terminase large subunit-like protein